MLYRNPTTDRKDAETALKYAGLYNQETWDQLKRHRDFLADGLWSLHEAGLLNQNILHTLLTSENATAFCYIIKYLFRLNVLSLATLEKFTFLSKKKEHLSFVYSVLDNLRLRDYNYYDCKRLLFVINQLDDLTIAIDVSTIISALPYPYPSDKAAQACNPNLLRLLSRPENQVLWSGLARIRRENNRMVLTEYSVLEGLIDAEVQRVDRLPLLRIPAEK